MMTGYEQVRSIAADLAGDKEAAARVELVLPETGVCTRGGVESTEAASGCCGGPAKQEPTTCCAADESAKKAGASGCGCS
jgi:2-keto-3-deoxy-6-phosphogluconate aldolase